MREQKNLRALLLHAVLLLSLGFMVFPFFWMVTTALKSNRETMAVPPLMFPGVKHFIRDTNEAGKGELVEVEILPPTVAAKDSIPVRILLGKNKGQEKSFPAGEIVDKTFLFDNFAKAWGMQPFAAYFFNTFFIAFVVTFCQLLTSALAAYAFAFMNFPYKEPLFFLLLGTLMIPQQALLIPNFIVLSGLGWINTYKALIVPWCASVFGIFFLRQFFMQLPKELYEAAIIDGCSRLGFFVRILLPLSVPPLTTISIFTFLGSWNSFLWPLMVTNSEHLRTIEVGLSYFNLGEGSEFELLMAASTLCIIPLVLFYFAAQKHFIASVAATGMKD